MSIPNLLDAIRAAKENERTASQSYAESVSKIKDPMGKKLFEELSAFEQHHYEQLTELEKSLEETGDYVNYKGREFPLPPVFEVKAAREPETKSIMKIISEAIELEQEAEKAYADLASQTMDQRGYEMFRRLSEEEHEHYILLQDAYWTLTNLGVWRYSHP